MCESAWSCVLPFVWFVASLNGFLPSALQLKSQWAWRVSIVVLLCRLGPLLCGISLGVAGPLADCVWHIALNGIFPFPLSLA